MANNQKGFTLIELVVVIVILGILAATAAPRFINIQGDATLSTLQALKGSMESAAALTHSKSIIDGNDQATNAVTIALNTGNVVVANGWPNAATATWDNLLEVSADEFTSLENSPTASGSAAGSAAGEFIIFPENLNYASVAAAKAGGCYAIYTESQSTNTKPVITVVDDGTDADSGC